jgi:hypothetical protein
MRGGELHQGLIALRSRLHRQLTQHPTRAGIDRRRAVGVHMGAGPDDDLNDLRQTSHAFISLPEARTWFPARAETAGL